MIKLKQNRKLDRKSLPVRSSPTNNPKEEKKIESPKKDKKSVKKKKNYNMSTRQIEILPILAVLSYSHDYSLHPLVSLKYEINANTFKRDLGVLAKNNLISYNNNKVTLKPKGQTFIEQQFGIPVIYQIQECANSYEIGSVAAQIEYHFAQGKSENYLGILSKFHKYQGQTVTNLETKHGIFAADSVFCLSVNRNTTIRFVFVVTKPFAHLSPILVRSYFAHNLKKLAVLEDFSFSSRDKQRFEEIFQSSITKYQFLVIADDPNMKSHVRKSVSESMLVLTLDEFRTVDWEKNQ